MTEIISKYEIEHDSPITYLRLFTLKTDVECPHFISQGKYITVFNIIIIYLLVDINAWQFTGREPQDSSFHN